MTSDLRGTWNDVAYHWDDWGPPLRPCAEDLAIFYTLAGRWQETAGDPEHVRALFLWGVTPEIALMRWPFPAQMRAMDQAESMVRVVWPGDVRGVRTAVVGDWLEPGLEAESQDIVVGDGGLVFFDPDGQRALLDAAFRILRPGGLLLYRHYAQAHPRESLEHVLQDARAGRIGSFHVFKWRLAMAMQASGASGVRQHDVWQAWTDSGIEPAGLPQPGWSGPAVGTIRFYRDKQARLYFPTTAELRDLVGRTFDEVEMVTPDYELGERCPIFSARRRG